MKSIQNLQGDVKYVSGKTAYKGAIKSYYAGTLHEMKTVRPQISNAGQVLLQPEEDITAVCKKLHKGQIGAMKADEVINGGTTVCCEYVAEVYDLTEARKVANPGRNMVDILNDSLSYTGNAGEKYSLYDVLELRKQHVTSNTAIRKRIAEVKAAYGYSGKGKMPEELFKEVQRLYSQLTSVTGFDLVITTRHEHTLCLNDDYVICQDPAKLQTAVKRADYIVQGNRLWATGGNYQCVIPIQTKEQIKTIREIVSQCKNTSLPNATTVEVCSETWNPSGLDLPALAEQDRLLTESRRN